MVVDVPGAAALVVEDEVVEADVEGLGEALRGNPPHAPRLHAYKTGKYQGQIGTVVVPKSVQRAKSGF